MLFINKVSGIFDLTNYLWGHHPMDLQAVVNDIAAQMGLFDLEVTLVDGIRLGCTDVHLLNISTRGHVTNSLVYRCDIESLQEGIVSDRFELRIRNALSRLLIML